MKVMVESHTLGKNIGGKRTKMHGQKGFYYDSTVKSYNFSPITLHVSTDTVICLLLDTAAS